MMSNLTEAIKTLSEDEKGLLNNLLKDLQMGGNINLSDSNGEVDSTETIKAISEELTERIIKELKAKLSHSTENSDNKLVENSQNKIEIDSMFSNAQSNGDSTNSNNDFSNKESEILNNLLGKEDNCDKQINKVTNFMTQFIEAKNGVSDNFNVEDVSNVTVNRNNFSGDIIKAVKFMDLNGMKDLTVKVVPRELGEVIINLTMESGIMKANISSTNKETVNILSANLHDINEKLNNSDMKIQNVTIDIYNDDTTFYSDQFARNSNSHGNKKGNRKGALSVDAIEDEVIDQNDYEADGNVNILA
jgi:flagellar hook-length control protein FliK